MDNVHNHNNLIIRTSIVLIFMIGTLEDMCSEEEMHNRTTWRQLDLFEMSQDI